MTNQPQDNHGVPSATHVHTNKRLASQTGQWSKRFKRERKRLNKSLRAFWAQVSAEGRVLGSGFSVWTWEMIRRSVSTAWLGLSAVTRRTRTSTAALTIWAIHFINRLYVYYRVQHSTRAKCPGCGIRAEHKIQWHPVLLKMLNFCGRCQAVWADDPIVHAEDWELKALEIADDTPDQQPQSQVPWGGAQRRPLIVGKDGRVMVEGGKS